MMGTVALGLMLAGCADPVGVCTEPELMLDFSAEVSEFEVGTGSLFSYDNEQASVEGTAPICVADRRHTRGYIQENAVTSEMRDLPPLTLTIGDVELESTEALDLHLYEAWGGGPEADMLSIRSERSPWLVNGELVNLGFELQLEDLSGELLDVRELRVDPDRMATARFSIWGYGSLAGAGGSAVTRALD